MEKEIKARQVHKNVKVLDKSVVMEHIKHSYIHTKESMEQQEHQRDNNPVEQAERELSDGADRGVRKAVYYSGRIVNVRRERKRDIRELQKQEKQKEAWNSTVERNLSRIKEMSRGTVKTVAKGEKYDKMGRKAGQAVKGNGERTIKNAQRWIQTTSQKSRAIPYTKRMLELSRMEAKASVKTTQKVVKVIQGVVQTTVSAVRTVSVGTKTLATIIAAGGWMAILIILIIVVFGSSLFLLGGNTSSNYIPVSQEVEDYVPLIRKYAKEHGIAEYEELIKAVMMQESGGRGGDPMQASECGYNTKYPRVPNGITEPEYSINVGIHNLADCINQAGVKNPIDRERIQLALQGYNYGNGYILWAIEKYGGYSSTNAIEFATMMANQLGWQSYGDINYVSHVLRYYPFGQIIFNQGNRTIVEVALTQVGNEGGKTYWSWYGYDEYVVWCACFVSWCAEQCGYINEGVIPKFSYCPTGADWFKMKNQWKDRDYEPTAGNIIFFDWEGDGISDHVGIVEKCEGGIVYTVEGNSGNAVKQKQYRIGSSSIYGYGIPTC